MNRVLLARLIDLVIVLFGVSVIVFLMIRLIPGDAVAIMLGANTEITPERMAELNAPRRPRPADRRAIPALGRRGAARRFRHLALDRPARRGRNPRCTSGRRWSSPSSRSLVGAVLAVPVGCLMAQTRGGAADVAMRVGADRRPDDPVLLARHRADPAARRSSAPGFASLGYVPFSRGSARQSPAHDAAGHRAGAADPRQSLAPRALGHARRAGPGLHPHRPRQGPAASGASSTSMRCAMR